MTYTDLPEGGSMSQPKTLVEKVWERHVVHRAQGEPDLLYVDLHMVHEVTSPQAFEGLRLAGRKVRRPDLTLATMDHNVPTTEDRKSTRLNSSHANIPYAGFCLKKTTLPLLSPQPYRCQSPVH